MLFRAVRILSTALLMSSSMMVCLWCRAMGQTPIFDQLWGELINADVSSSDVAGCRFADSGRHCLHEEESGAAAVGMRRGRPGTATRTGWRGRVRACPPAGWAGDEWGTGGVDAFPAAAPTEVGVPTKPRHARNACPDGPQLPDRAE